MDDVHVWLTAMYMHVHNVAAIRNSIASMCYNSLTVISTPKFNIPTYSEGRAVLN